MASFLAGGKRRSARVDGVDIIYSDSNGGTRQCTVVVVVGVPTWYILLALLVNVSCLLEVLTSGTLSPVLA